MLYKSIYVPVLPLHISYLKVLIVMYETRYNSITKHHLSECIYQLTKQYSNTANVQRTGNVGYAGVTQQVPRASALYIIKAPTRQIQVMDSLMNCS